MASKYFVKTKINGADAYSLDYIDGNEISASDISTVITATYVYNYSLVNATTVTATVNNIKPDVNGTSFRWSLTDLYTTIFSQSSISEPSDPKNNMSVLWLSNGTGAGEEGNLMIKINVSGIIKSTNLLSPLPPYTTWTLHSGEDVTLHSGGDAILHE